MKIAGRNFEAGTDFSVKVLQPSTLRMSILGEVSHGVMFEGPDGMAQLTGTPDELRELLRCLTHVVETL